MSCCCDSCKNIVDGWFSLGISDEDPYKKHIHTKRFMRIHPQISKEVFRIFNTMTQSKRKILSTTLLHALTVAADKECPEKAWILTIDIMMMTEYKTDLEYILSILEDNAVVRDRNIALRWLGMNIIDIWAFIYEVHKCHSKEGEFGIPSIAPGLRSWNLKLTSRSSHVADSINQSGTLSEIVAEIREELHDLYS